MSNRTQEFRSGGMTKEDTEYLVMNSSVIRAIQGLDMWPIVGPFYDLETFENLIPRQREGTSVLGAFLDPICPMQLDQTTF